MNRATWCSQGCSDTLGAHADPAMTCSNCGTENRSGRKFCSACGAPLSHACLTCGALNEPDDRFCGECGTALDVRCGTSRPARGRRPSRSGNSSRCSSPTSSGFTTLSEARDPEEVRELLTRYFDDRRGRSIERYGGTVEKFIGDAVMAVWGAPVTARGRRGARRPRRTRAGRRGRRRSGRDVGCRPGRARRGRDRRGGRHARATKARGWSPATW